MNSIMSRVIQIRNSFLPRPTTQITKPPIDKDAAYVMAVSDALEQAKTEDEAKAAVAEINRRFGVESNHQ